MTQLFHSGALRAAALLVAAYLGASSGASAQAPDCTPAGGPVQLEYWTWGDGYDKVTDLWNSQHPDIQVHFSSIPGGNQGGYQKMLNAITAGTSPDVGFVEFDTLNQFKLQDGLTNIANCLKPEQLADYVPAIFRQVQLGEDGAVYGLPANSGPMVLYYRADLLKKYNIKVPTTWEEFADAAAAVRKADPTAYLANFSAASANWFAALAAQAGAQWFSADDEAWTVNLHDVATQKVAGYWHDLIAKDLVSTTSSFSPDWSSALATGKLWSWVSAAWGAGIIRANAPDSSGNWAVAPMPVWGDGTGSAASTWGGGALTVPSGGKHPYEAAQFAYFVTTDPGALKILRDAIGVYPTSKTLLASDVFQVTDPYFGGQKVFDIVGKATESLPDITFGPSMAATYGAISDAFGDAHGDLKADLVNAEQQVVSDLKRQGIPVK